LSFPRPYGLQPLLSRISLFFSQGYWRLARPPVGGWATAFKASPWSAVRVCQLSAARRGRGRQSSPCHEAPFPQPPFARFWRIRSRFLFCQVVVQLLGFSADSAFFFSPQEFLGSLPSFSSFLSWLGNWETVRSVSPLPQPPGDFFLFFADWSLWVSTPEASWRVGCFLLSARFRSGWILISRFSRGSVHAFLSLVIPFFGSALVTLILEFLWCQGSFSPSMGASSPPPLDVGCTPSISC